MSPTAMLELRVGYSRSDGGKFPFFLGTEGVGQRFGIPNVPSDPRFTGGIYRQHITGYTALGVQNSNPQYQNPDVLNPKVNFSKIARSAQRSRPATSISPSTRRSTIFPRSTATDVYAGQFSRPADVSAGNNLQ
jgi:hypothetical protein